MKAPLLSLLAGAFVCSQAPAALYIYDPYTTGGGANYEAGQSLSSAHNMAAGPAEWAGDLAGSTSYNVSATGLSYAGLATSGGSLDSVPSGTNRRSFSGTNISGTLYYSYLINYSAFQDYVVLGLADASGTYVSGGVMYMNSGIPGLRASAASGFESNTYVELGLNTTYLIVGRVTYTLNNTVTDLWINPVPGQAQPVSSDLTALGTLSLGAAQWYSALAAPSPTYQFDEFRVGSTWADVTPVPEPQSMALLLMTGLAAVAIRRRFRTPQAL